MPLTFPSFPDGVFPWGEKFRTLLATLRTVPEDYGIVTVGSVAARDALQLADDGQRVHVATLDRIDAFLGGRWKPIAGALPHFEVAGTTTQELPGGRVTLLEKWTTPTLTGDSFTAWNGSALQIKHPGVYSLSGTLAVLDGGEISVVLSISSGATSREFYSDGSGSLSVPAVRLKAGDFVGLAVFSQIGGRTSPSRQSLFASYLHP